MLKINVFKEKMSRLPDNPLPKGERRGRVREEALVNFVSAVIPLRVWCAAVMNTQAARATPLEPDELGVLFPSRTRVKGVANV